MAEYIEREELLRIEKLLDTEVLRASKTASNIYDQILYDIENFPAADVVPVVHGKWIDKGWDGDFSWRIDGRGNSWHIFECSNCGSKLCGVPKTKFCQNCGARMDLEDEKDD